MADPLIRQILAGDPEVLSGCTDEHSGVLRSAYDRNPSDNLSSVMSFETFSAACLRVAARRSKSGPELAGALGKLLAHPQARTCIGLLNGFEPSSNVLPGELIERYWKASSAEYRSFTLPLAEFAKDFMTRAASTCLRTGCSLQEVVDKRVRYPDIYLAIAALHDGDAIGGKARDEFTRLYYKPVAQRYVKLKWGNLSMSEDRVQDLFLALLYEHYPSEKTGNPKPGAKLSPPLLASYRGDGLLAAWISLSLGNMIRDSLRTTREDYSLNEERESDEGGTSSLRFEPAVPAVQADEGDRTPCLKMLQEGLALGWQRLKARERLTLILQTLHKVPPSLIARRIFQVHEGTITKYTTSSLEKIHSAIEEFAQSHMQLSHSDIGDCFRYAREAFPETEDLAGGMVAYASRGE